MASPDVVHVPLRSIRRRRALAVQKFQHLIPAFPLLIAGVQALSAEPHGLTLLLGMFEIGTSLLLLGTVVREVKGLRRPRPHGGPQTHAAHGIDWFHVFAAGVLLAEAAEHWHLTHHWRRPTLLTAAVTLALGLAHGRLEALNDDRRSLKVSDEGVSVGGRPFGTFRARWDDLAAIECDERFATIRRRDGGTRRIDLNDCEQPIVVRHALAVAQRRMDATRSGTSD